MSRTGARSLSSSSRGYFALGVEGLSKAHNAGALTRTAHAFGAAFFFVIGGKISQKDISTVDTSAAAEHLPCFHYETPAQLTLPQECPLIGVELTENAVFLPRFRHPRRAAYVLGPENGSLSPEIQARCQELVQIPTRFCLNVGLAGAILMYDRHLKLNA